MLSISGLSRYDDNAGENENRVFFLFFFLFFLSRRKMRRKISVGYSRNIENEDDGTTRNDATERKMSSDKGVPLQSSETIRLNPTFYRWMDGRGGGWDGRGSSPPVERRGETRNSEGISRCSPSHGCNNPGETRDLSSDPWQ